MKKWLSYLFPFSIKKLSSKHHGQLEISLVNGKKVLDTSNSNYSYGSLQQILKKGIQSIRFEPNTNDILVLGMGVGSILQTLRDDFDSKAIVDLVEFDPQIIELAVQDFNLEKYQPYVLYEMDAFHYLQNCNKYYQLIVVDLFIGNKIPEQFISPAFVQILENHLQKGGKIIFNTMAQTLPKTQLEDFIQEFENLHLQVTVLWGVAYTNNLLLIEKT
jgi:spermidine synthase